MCGALRILVTGASRGIGRAVVEGLVAARTGNRDVIIYAGYRNPAAVPFLEALGTRPVRLDVTEKDCIREACKIIREDGQLDVLINNAGVLLEREGYKVRSIVEPTISINVQAQIAVTEAFLPLIRDSGQIINVSSGAGTRTFGSLDVRDQVALRGADASELPQILIKLANGICERIGEEICKETGTPIYGLSKAGLNCYTQLLAREHPRLRVNACSPGFCQTEIGGTDVVYTRQPKSAALGASVIVKLALGELGAKQSGFFFKEMSKPGTPLDQAVSGEESWGA